MILPDTCPIQRRVSPAVQSTNARWMDWQERRWTSSRAQMHGLAELDIERSHTTMAEWRNGVIPEGETLIALFRAFPSLRRIFWREEQAERASLLLAKLDALEAEISTIRELL